MDGWIGLSGCGKWMESGCGKWMWMVESGAVPDLTIATHSYFVLLQYTDNRTGHFTIGEFYKPKFNNSWTCRVTSDFRTPGTLYAFNFLGLKSGVIWIS